MVRRASIVIIGICFLFSITGCSVGMALSGKKEPNLGAFRVGSTRGEAEMQLGSPISSVTTPEGNRTDLYEYELGNEPSTGRAIGHGVMDVLTLGLWEVVGTPIEGFTGSKHRMTIVYGPDDRIIAINQAPVPPPPAEEKDELDIESRAATDVLEMKPEAKAVTGTCFAVDQNGTLLSAYHIVQDAKSIQVHLVDGTVTEAKLWTFNAKKDLAILRIDPRTPHFLSLAPMGSVHTGERVFTMGYPAPDLLGQESKFTEGSVSALSGPGDKEFLIQISVPIQPGNSGGPVVNQLGEVVGVVTSTAAIEAFLPVTGTLPQNVNWAIKADHARPMFDVPIVKSAPASRDDVIKKLRRAICMVQAGPPLTGQTDGVKSALDSSLKELPYLVEPPSGIVPVFLLPWVLRIILQRPRSCSPSSGLGPLLNPNTRYKWRSILLMPSVLPLWYSLST